MGVGGRRWAVAKAGNYDQCSGVLPSVMWRLFFIVLVSVLFAGAQPAKIPLATFNGTVHGVSNKQITIETSEGNLVDFDINRNTKIMRGKKQIKASEIETGDIVTIDAKQEMVKFLVAVAITAQPKD